MAGTPIPPPGEVAGLAFSADAVTLTWDPIPGAPAGSVYDVARGVVGELPVGSGASESCLATGVAGPPAPDPDLPEVGRSLWYLVRGRHACGTGTWGYAAANGVPGAERVTAACR